MFDDDARIRMGRVVRIRVSDEMEWRCILRCGGRLVQSVRE